MCQFKSAVVVKAGEGIKIFTLPFEDRHTKIREAHNIRDNGALCKQTPVELVPVTGLSKITHFKFIFDDQKPDWWEDEFTDQVTRELFSQAIEELKDYKGETLNLKSVTAIEKGVVFPEKISGYLNLKSVTAIEKGVVFPKECGYLYLNSVTAIEKGVVFPEKISGSLNLNSVTAIEKGVVFPEKISGSLYLKSLPKKEREIVRNMCGR